MSIKRDSLLIIGFLLSMVTCKQPDTTPVNRYLDNPQHISVLTQHNDNTRAGLNSQETLLTTTNVNSQSFGKLFTLQVDNQVYAQPLVVGSLTLASGTHNVVFIATVSNTLYAFDGDTGTLYWTKNFTQPGMRTPKATDMKSSWCSPYTNITSNIGIVGTPVIDPTTNTIYFVARSTDGTHFFQHLHAVSIVTGDEQSGSPIEIKASIAGSGDGSVNGIVSFDPLRNNQRQGLVLVGSTVYIAYASHCDWNPFHGWILGYDSKTLEQKIVYNVTPDGEEGGLWQSGMGIAADDQGNLFVDLYKEAGRQAGHSPEKLIVGLHSLGYVAPSTEQAVSDYFPGYAETFTRIGKERGWPPVTRSRFEAQRGPLGAFLVGGPEEVAEKILRHSNSLGGLSRVSFQMDNAGLSHQQLLNSIEIIGSQVIPLVNKG